MEENTTFQSVGAQDEVEEKQLFSPEIVWSTNDEINVIKEMLKITQNRKQSYAYKR